MALALELSEMYAARVHELDDCFRSQLVKSKVRSGAYRTAVLMKGGVIKVSRSKDRQSDLVTEFRFIEQMRNDPKVARHFPETHLIQLLGVTLLVQERVARVRNIDNDDGRDGPFDAEVELLAESLGISDMHCENFGWAGPRGREWPVFIDVDMRNEHGATWTSTAPKVRSWMIRND